MNFEGRTFCLITGGSRGFGRAVAVAFAEQCSFKSGSQMVMVSRDESGLNETKGLVEKVNQNIIVKVILSDLGNLGSLDNTMTQIFNVNIKDFDTAVLVNNAGSVGNIEFLLKDHASAEYTSKYFDLNVASCFSLTSKFVCNFKSISTFVINVSSLAAIQEMPCMSLYCSGKAARDMFHKCLACEEEDVRVLNYAPGPMDTDMSMDIQLKCGHEGSRFFFKDMREKKTIIKPSVSAAKLIKILKMNVYKSGDHIDFYDVEL